VAYGEASLRAELAATAQTVFEALSSEGDFLSVRAGMTDEEVLRILADRAVSAKGVFQGGGPQADALLSKVLQLLAPVHFRIYGVKPASFQDEQEWRIIRYQQRAPTPNLEFATDETTIRPFIPCLVADGAKGAIRKVMLGPKHRSDPNWVRAFVKSVGLDDVEVSRSAIDSYR
jgi:hypothetical protein